MIQNGKVFSESKKDWKGFQVPRLKKTELLYHALRYPAHYWAPNINSQGGCFFPQTKISPLVISFRSIKASRHSEYQGISHVLLFHSQHTFQFVHIIFTILLIVHHLSHGGGTIPPFTNLANHPGCKKKPVNNKISDLLNWCRNPEPSTICRFVENKNSDVNTMSILCDFICL